MSKLAFPSILKSTHHTSKPIVTSFQVLSALMFFITFVFSIIFAPYHFGGDQVHYARAYSAMGRLSLIEAVNEYPAIIHTREVGHMLIIWVFSSIGVGKNVLMATANAFLAILFAKVLRKKGASLLMVIWITVSAYYLYTMFFTLERTKFAFIFMLLYLLTEKRLWILMAVLTHSLMLIPLGLYVVGQKMFGSRLRWHIKPFRAYFPEIFWALVAVVALMLFAGMLGMHIYYKLLYYYSESLGNDLFESLPLVVLCGLTLMTTKDKRKTILFFVGLLVLVIFFGSSRINMIGYFVFLYFSNFQHQAFKFSVVMIGLYLLYKSWVYLVHIYNFGT